MSKFQNKTNYYPEPIGQYDLKGRLTFNSQTKVGQLEELLEEYKPAFLALVKGDMSKIPLAQEYMEKLFDLMAEQQRIVESKPSGVHWRIMGLEQEILAGIGVFQRIGLVKELRELVEYGKKLELDPNKFPK